MTPFEHLIEEFAAATGLKLAPDEQDSCTLSTERVSVTIQHRRDRDEVVLFAPVAESDAENGAFPAAVLAKALSLAYDGRGTGGAFLGLFQNALVLTLRLPFEGLDADTLGVRLAAFADVAEGVAAELEAAGGASGAVSDGVQPPPDTLQDGFSRIEP
jgi:hypothetical protein